MTQGRPPKNEVAGEDRDTDDEQHAGARSQTRSVEGEKSPPRSAPRAAFGPASNGPPPQPDADKTVKRPYPTAWGQTLPAGGEAMEEKTKVSRSVFSQTLGGEPAPAPSIAPNAHPQPSRSARPQAEGDDAFEPLRVPSHSPSPAPFQQSRGSAARTILIAGAPAAPPPPEPPAPRPAARRPGTSAAPKATQPIGALDEAKFPPRAPGSAAKRTMALGSAELVPDAGAPPDREAGSASAGSRRLSIGAPHAPNISEPLHLQLDARDVLESADVQAPGRSSRAPLYAGIAVAILIAGALAGWIGTRGKSVPTADPTLRGDGVLAQDSPQAAAPVANPAPAASPTPAAAAPAAPAPTAPVAAAPAAPVAAQPAAAAPANVPADDLAEKAAGEAASPDDEAERPAATPTAKKAPARKRRAASAPTNPNEPVSDDVREARDALRALDEPVMKIQRSDDGEEFDAPKPEPPDTPDLPEPPPAPQE